MIAPAFDLHVVPNFLSAEACGEIIDEMRSAPAAAALTYGQAEEGLIAENVRRTRQVKISPETVSAVRAKLCEYRERLEEHFRIKLSDCEEPQFLWYRTGDFFVAHQDGNTGLLQLASDRSRRVSVSIFLNSESELIEDGAYRGGSLVFSDWRSDKSRVIRGEAGMLVAFRSELTHEVKAVTGASRYSIVTWFGAD